MKFTITSQPIGTDIISLSDVKEFIRVDHSDEDTTILAIIDAATQAVQDYTGRHFVSSPYTVVLDAFYNCEFPTVVTSISSVTYYDSANDLQTLDASKYFYDVMREPARIKFIDAPNTYENRFNSVTINGNTGKQATPTIKQAIKLLIGHYYENRRSVIFGASPKELPLGIAALLNPSRVISAV